MKRAKISLGTVSHATLRSEDLVPAFAAELRRLRGALPRDMSNNVRAFLAGKYDTDHGCDVELVQELEEALQKYAPDYCYFGAHPGDGADFGFWLSEDWQEQAKEDGVKFVSDLSEVSDTFRGLLCVVNDHGNATLYCTDKGVGTLREIWSVV